MDLAKGKKKRMGIHLKSLAKLAEEYLWVLLNSDTQKVPAIKNVTYGARPLSDNSCARVNALIAHSSWAHVQLAYKDQILTVETVRVHPYYDDRLLVTFKGYPQSTYLELPGTTDFILNLWRKRE